MAFHLIDMDTWERREHYYYYKDFLKVRYNLNIQVDITEPCLLYTSPSPRDGLLSRMPSSA